MGDIDTTQLASVSADNPQGSEEQPVDWEERARQNLAESRKHEDREKEWKKRAKLAEEKLEALAAKAEQDRQAAQSGENADLAKQLAEAQETVKKLQAEQKRGHLVREIASEKGVSPDVLERMRGDSEAEIREAADLLLSATGTEKPRNWPSVNDRGASEGSGSRQTVSVKDLLEERDPAKQVEMIRKGRTITKE